MRFFTGLFFLLLFSVSLFSQTRKDSLLRAYRNGHTPEEKADPAYYLVRYWLQRDEDDSARVYLPILENAAKRSANGTPAARFHFAYASFLTREGRSSEAVARYEKAIVILRNNNDRPLLAEVLAALANEQSGMSKYDDAIRNGLESAAISETGKPVKTSCEALLAVGSAFLQMGNKPEALENIQRSLHIAREIKNRHYEMESLIFLGSIYNEGKTQEKGLAYFLEAEKIANEQKIEAVKAPIKIYIANYYYEKKDYKRSLEIYTEAARLTKEQQSWENYAGALGNIGNIYYDLGQYLEAEGYHREAIAIFDENEAPQGSVIALSNLAKVKRKLQQYDSSEYFYLKSQHLAEEMHSLLDYIENYEGLAGLYKDQKNYEKAFYYQGLFKQYSDSVFNESNTQKMTELEMNYKFQQKEKERDLEDEAKAKRRNLIYLVILLGIAGLLVIVIMIWRVSAIRKRTNQTLEASNREISNQKNIIEEKNKEITDSINYAERIQRALLGSEAMLKQHVADHFIMNRPKDIVSGDFFWSVYTREKLVVVTADCTGHGVPGAFMSMIGVNFLNYLVMQQHLTGPGEILSKLRDEIVNALNPKGIEQEGRDGIDMVLCVYDFKNMQMQYAAANNPLWVVRSNAVTIYPPDKMPVGKYEAAFTHPFTTHTIALQPGDIIYTFTDGYADQFGGARGKKFKYKPLQEMLLTNSARSFHTQLSILETTFDSWKSNLEQVDDVLVVGIKIS